MPTPISTSASLSSKFGLPAAGTVHDVKSHAHRARLPVHALPQRLKFAPRHAHFSGGADDLLHDQRSGDAAPPRRIGRGFDRDIVVGDDRGATALGHFRRHLEVHDVAFVILDDEDDACALIDRLDRRDHLIRRRRGEDLSRAGRVQHAEADESGMQWFVPRTAAGDERDFSGLERFATNELPFVAEHDDVGVRRDKAVKAFTRARIPVN